MEPGAAFVTGAVSSSPTFQGSRHVQLCLPTVPGVLRRSRSPSTSVMGVRTASEALEYRSSRSALRVASVYGRASPRRSFRNGCLSCSRRSRSESASHQRSEEHTSELQSRVDLVCRLLLEKKKHK